MFFLFTSYLQNATDKTLTIVRFQQKSRSNAISKNTSKLNHSGNQAWVRLEVPVKRNTAKWLA